MDEQKQRRGSVNGHADVIRVDGVTFARVGVLVWARPVYAVGTGDAVVWECASCGSLVARPPLHANAHRASVEVLAQRAPR